jgi:hypothetical protein
MILEEQLMLEKTTEEKTNLFSKLNGFLKKEKPPEKRMIRHPQEREIINIALANLSHCDMGRALLSFVDEHHLDITVLRGRKNRDYASSKNAVFISVGANMDITDPEITIHMAGSIRETMQEYDQHLRRLSVDNSENAYVLREEQKHEDKLFWQTGIVYEMGRLHDHPEYIDAFMLMGYGALVDAYERDLDHG